jgi:phosphotransferase family enzyme
VERREQHGQRERESGARKLRDRQYAEVGSRDEIDLPAGDVTEGVVRVGDTVRRPHQPQSFAVAAYLDHLERVGFDASPRYLGRDAAGRDVLTFMAGDVAGDPPEAWALTDALLASVARLVKRLHEASAGYYPAGGLFPPRPSSADDAELITHLDVTPQNVVVRDGEAVGLIDFDLAGPSTRLLDSLNTAMHWVPLRDPVDLRPGSENLDQFARLRIFADAYGWTAEQRRRLPSVAAERAEISWSRMKERAETLGGGWARMWSEGVGDLILRRRAWLLANEARLVEVLLA